MHYQGKTTTDRLKKAAELVENNNRKIKETYNIFRPYIKNIITYEELSFTEEDLKLLDVTKTSNSVSITKKQVQQKDKEKIIKKDLAKYILESEFVL
jgi:propanediol dehydratase small subunit